MNGLFIAAIIFMVVAIVGLIIWDLSDSWKDSSLFGGLMFWGGVIFAVCMLIGGSVRQNNIHLQHAMDKFSERVNLNVVTLREDSVEVKCVDPNGVFVKLSYRLIDGVNGKVPVLYLNNTYTPVTQALITQSNPGLDCTRRNK